MEVMSGNVPGWEHGRNWLCTGLVQSQGTRGWVAGDERFLMHKHTGNQILVGVLFMEYFEFYFNFVQIYAVMKLL